MPPRPAPPKGRAVPPPRRSLPGSFARAGECFGGSLSLWVLSGDGIWGFWVSPERQEEEEGGPGCFAISPPRPPPPRCEKAGASCRGKGGNGVRIDASLAACQQHCAYWSRIMDPCWTWGAMALLCLLMLGGHPNPCRVSIYPEEPTVEFGSSLLLNCTSSCRNYSRLNWEVSITKMGTQGPGWVSLSIPNVTSWSLELQCFGIFGQQRNIAETTLHAYRFLPPQIYLEGDTVAGKEARVTCNTSAQVSPHDPPNLHLTLWGGGLPTSTHRGPSVGLSFTAQLEQHGQEVMCEAVLRLGRRTVNASAAVTLWVWAAPHDVQVWAPQTVFTTGDNLTVMCRAEGNPPPQLRWEMPTNTSWELWDGGTTITIPAAQRVHDGTYRCLAENRYGTGAASIDLVFRGYSRSPLIPVVVTLAMVTVLAVVAVFWWLYRTQGWKPMPSQPS
ncbi:intercellular adhesion molecule 3-like isoform X2 [Accipiter gentilis]|uniref:intercellular adhesion molecule 3-like isoform X2 n=1 Tax=Astur gentilis TaxID=8957 RepID=UPI00210FA720|nr:intercellular adhesion molecule 3-like isoform X2 [Accipiter gentilis]